ncbi:unknown protein [Seminavis robusta]|uniref:Uncharacterized protein n=1 Tax=Seminavis robusta TaxID=568900 RepID=A0A9N8EM91_9STRA|nr:unknown protein [Seminavis robusta]|eukprot:Sro1355_g265540.1 n/a (132) ;mRNA; f:15438-15833
MPEKGDAIRFVKGTYAGYNGWMNKSKRTKPKSPYRYVVVDLKDSHEKATRVKLTSIKPRFEAPRCFEEAALQQYEDMEQAMVRLAELFAQCGIGGPLGAMQLFEEELNRAVKVQRELGSKARFRRVDWTQN